MIFLIPSSIQTARLNLRIPEDRDWQALHNYYGDPVCARFTNGQPLSEDQTKNKLTWLRSHWDIKQYGSYVMEEIESGNVIGITGLDYPDDWPEPEIQWGLSTAYWGKGYASEGARAVKEIAKQFLPTLSLISLIHPLNESSVNLAKALGAVFEKEYWFRNATWHIYRH